MVTGCRIGSGGGSQGLGHRRVDFLQILVLLGKGNVNSPFLELAVDRLVQLASCTAHVIDEVDPDAQREVQPVVTKPHEKDQGSRAFENSPILPGALLFGAISNQI